MARWQDAHPFGPKSRLFFAKAGEKMRESEERCYAWIMVEVGVDKSRLSISAFRIVVTTRGRVKAPGCDRNDGADATLPSDRENL